MSNELTILYGTETGNAEDLANRTLEKAKKLGLQATIENIADISVDKLKEYQQVLIVISTWGDGDPPSEAVDFCEAVEEGQLPELPRLRYTVLALGDRDYEDFCGCGRKVDEGLAKAGAKAYMKREELDVDFEDTYEPWAERFFTALKTTKAPDKKAVAPAAPAPVVAADTKPKAPEAKPVASQKGEKIRIQNGKIQTPDCVALPFIEGDGIGPDIWAASQRVFDAAVERAYNGKRKVEWLEVLAGEKAHKQTGDWLPEATLKAFREYHVGIKGPLATPVGGGIRSLNVALRQELDLYVCQRPVCFFEGIETPLKHPEQVDMVIFRENTEDIYAGIEFEAASEDAKAFKALLRERYPERYAKIRFPDSAGLGIKPVSQEGTARLVRAAIQYALDQGRKSVTLVHKGNIMKFTEGAFRDWGYAVARDVFGGEPLDGGPWMRLPNGLIVKDVIADAFLQQILLRPSDYDVIATLNLNGDYISDALAAQVGGIGIAPGGNLNYDSGHAIFEATHGTAPKYAGQDKVNPGSVILSGEMMFRYLGWNEAADCILKGLKGALLAKRMTYDLARLIDGATTVKCSEFGDAIIAHMKS